MPWMLFQHTCCTCSWCAQPYLFIWVSFFKKVNSATDCMRFSGSASSKEQDNTVFIKTFQKFELFFIVFIFDRFKYLFLCSHLGIYLHQPANLERDIGLLIHCPDKPKHAIFTIHALHIYKSRQKVIWRHNIILPCWISMKPRTIDIKIFQFDCCVSRLFVIYQYLIYHWPDPFCRQISKAEVLCKIICDLKIQFHFLQDSIRVLTQFFFCFQPIPCSQHIYLRIPDSILLILFYEMVFFHHRTHCLFKFRQVTLWALQSFPEFLVIPHIRKPAYVTINSIQYSVCSFTWYSFHLHQ